MPIDYATLPIQPPAPLPDNATDAQRAAWLDQHRICASYANAESQQATAEAMSKAADAQRAIAEFGASPEEPKRYTKGELVVILAPHFPQVTGLTDLNVVDIVSKQVDALAARFPYLIAQETGK